MKRFLILTGLCMLMTCMASAAPHSDGEQPPGVVICALQSADAPSIVVADIEYAFAAYEMPAQVQETYTNYQAMPVEVLPSKFRLEIPVFRLCRNRSHAYTSYIMNGKMARNNLPPNRWARCALEQSIL